MIRQGILVFEKAGAERTTQRFGGLSVLNRGVRTLSRIGCQRILVIVPEGVSTRITRLPQKLQTDVEVVTWGSRSRSSFYPGEGFLVLHGEYAHHHSSLTALARQGCGAADLVIQTSDACEQIAPLTAVTSGDSVVRFFDATPGDGQAVSTGAYLVGPALSPTDLPTATDDLLTFLSVRSAGRRIDTTQMAAPQLWRRVVDRRTARAARDMLFSQVTKSTSGPVSRHINARMSIPISKLLIETGISPHMVTVLFVLTTGLATAYFMTRADEYLCLVLAGTLWQLAAVLDRCDGEIARVKLAESKFGAWFDTITDNIAYLCVFAGMLASVNRILAPWQLNLAFSATLAILVTIAVMYAYAIKTGSGSLQRYLVGFSKHVPDEQKNAIYRWMERYAFVAKRDFFSFVFFVLSLANQFELIYWYTIGGVHLLAVGVLLSQRKMLEGHRTLVSQHSTGVATLDPMSAVPQGKET